LLAQELQTFKVVTISGQPCISVVISQRLTCLAVSSGESCVTLTVQVTHRMLENK